MPPRVSTGPVAGLLLLAAASACGETGAPISVMTRNLYLGADLAVLQSALTPADLTSLAGGVWRDVQASRFPERAMVVADEIVFKNPDVVALQEVSLYRTQMPGDWVSGAAPNATAVALDFLATLLDAIAARGGHYQAAVIGMNADEELPTTGSDGSPVDVRLTDRDVILVKEGLTFTPGPGGRFQTAFAFPVGGAGGATLTLNRGYVTANVTVGGKTVRVVNAHLEIGALLGRIQEEQTRELLKALDARGGPTILAGDFNSPADGSGTATYGLLTTKTATPSPFRDTWSFRQGSPGQDPTKPIRPGLNNEATCCLDLASAMSLPSERIDLILFRGGVQPEDAAIVDTARTTSGLWPSDHIGVWAKLQLR